MTASDLTIKPASDDQMGRPAKPGSSRLGIVLIIVSGVLWLSLFVIPFLQLTPGQKTAVGVGVFVAVQVTWWTGVSLSGPAVMRNLKNRFGGKNRT